MLKKSRILLVVVGLLFLISNVQASSFGSFPYEIEKQSSDLQLDYRIGFVNPSQDTLQVTLSSEPSSEYNISFTEKTFEIPPGVTNDPTGSGWYYLGDGRYAKIHEKSFQVDISKYRDDNRVVFPIRVEAASTGSGGTDTDSRSQLIQVRNYNYRAQIDPNLRPEERPEEDSESSWRDNFWQEENPENQQDFNLEQNKSSNQEQQTQKSNINQTNEASDKEQVEKSGSDSGGLNNTTIVLILGIVVSVAYIWMEV